MKYRYLIFLTLFTLLLFNLAEAQTGKISGSVFDEAKKPLDGATVTLIIAKDSALINSQLAEKDGGFNFQNLKDGTYLVKVSYIGYQNYVSNAIQVTGEKPVSLAAFILSPAGKTLKE